MTTTEAAALWGITTTTVSNYCEQGLVEGAYKARVPGYHRPRWVIPEDAPRPKKACKAKSDAQRGEHRVNPLPVVKGMAPIDYVWKYQNCSIGDLAKRLGVSHVKVTHLFDCAFEREMKRRGSQNGV